ncbi:MULTISPECIES: hypothetical protein [Rhizobium]|jgi:hypothetical protein|uniref:hypothetical protein n=1 Tax=Rhizobium TaxID=379 RepID=UPI000379B91C|nr:hypothetical protein [Rhizobium ruizarguesonis]TAZ86954.1 hypothetical protein ELH67_33205 [Rhizobium ruizarguesonis]TBA31942.1 hypothetical protein ELH60_25780 [Rhizobium ruizarguesonis]TBA50953.1 hypothetical protein ELH59_31910 [Rhizobium ruizarguesonis]TBA95543.1 hypothetical protein ELH55_29850 [Rhizobium ruizarguesonis]TBB36605.1 hypothetical protein ELH46_32390 [Rhizobium ruizarguesonis]
MTATTRNEDRAVGLVCHEEINGPAAHVLIVGVSSYASKAVPFVASPARSARAVAEWFLGKGNTDFKNRRTPLGSLAILLSEAEGGTESEVRGVSVPRATFYNVERAVEAWRSRAEAGEWAEDNLLVLFVVSHGESFGRRTAFLLEDYNTKPNNNRFGMSETEQLVEAVTALAPKMQLLIFDCCRLETGRNVGFDQDFGTPLLAIPPRQDARQPTVLRSTALREAAYGQDEGLTVFTDALLEAARGLAATPAKNWVIDSFSLAETVTRLVGLRRKDGAVLQRPGSAQSEFFPISKVEPAAATTAFIWLSSDLEFADTHFVERIADNKERAIPRANDGNEFLRLTFTGPAPRRIDARDSNNVSIGEVELTPYPPVVFQELPDRMSIARAMSRGVGPAHRGSGADLDIAQPLVEIVISVEQPNAALTNGAVATFMVDRTDATAAVPEPIVTILPTDGRETTMGLSAGNYTLVVASSSGNVQARRFTAEPDTETRIRVVLPAATSDFLARALSAGAVAEDATLRAPVPPEAVGTEMKPDLNAVAAPAWVEGRNAMACVVAQNIAGVDFFATLGNPLDPLVDNWIAADGVPGNGVLANLRPGPVNLRHALLTVDDKRTQPLRHNAAKAEDRPLWLALAGTNWREVAWCPTMGRAGQWMVDENGAVDPWEVEFVVDARPGSGCSHAVPVVQSRQWTALLAFLARRDFVNGGAIVAAMLADGSLRSAIEDKIDNPLAAIAGALVGIGAGKLEEAKVPLKWLENLANWFPNIPDGPILLARELRRRGEATEPEYSRALLLEAARRGVPGFSLALDWLSEELALHGEHPDCVEQAKRFRRLALMADPSRTFTVLRVD